MCRKKQSPHREMNAKGDFGYYKAWPRYANTARNTHSATIPLRIPTSMLRHNR